MSKELDQSKLFDLLEQGVPAKYIAQEMGVSTPTISKRIAALQRDQGVLLQYRAVQSLHLTALQSKILEAISPDKIEEASLKDLVLCYKVLKDKELVVEGKPTEIKGLVSYLIQLEKEQVACESVIVQKDSFSSRDDPQAKFDDVDFNESLEERLPNL
jgi:DNA-binding Lrp family transcriptional regulator